MSGLKFRMAAPVAAFLAAAFLVFLLWRGLKDETSGDPSLEFVWRDADESDLF